MTMKRLVQIWSLLVWLSLCICAWGTKQEWDELEWRGKEYDIQERPLSMYFGTDEYEKAMKTAEAKGLASGNGYPWKMISTATAKGYISRWRILDGKLYLVHFMGKLQGGRVGIDVIMPGDTLPVVASWYSGRITIPTGTPLELIESNGAHISELFSESIVFVVESGVVTDEFLEKVTVTRARDEIPEVVEQDIRRSW